MNCELMFPGMETDPPFSLPPTFAYSDCLSCWSSALAPKVLRACRRGIRGRVERDPVAVRVVSVGKTAQTAVRKRRVAPDSPHWICASSMSAGPDETILIVSFPRATCAPSDLMPSMVRSMSSQDDGFSMEDAPLASREATRALWV